MPLVSACLAAAPTGGGPGQALALGLALAPLGFGLFCVWTALRGLAKDLRAWQQAHASRAWTEAVATILSSEVHVEGRGRRITFEPRVTYRYEAGGRSLTGTQLGFAPWLTQPARDEAEAALSPYPAGASVPVYVDPQRPERATLVRGPPAGQLRSLLVALVVLAVGVAFLVAGWSSAGDAVRALRGA